MRRIFMSKRRAWLERKPNGGIVITQRDMRIFKTLLDYRFLFTSWIKKKFFGAKSKCDRRLRQLYDHKFIDRIQIPVLEGKAELLYALGKNGFTLLKQKGQIKEELGWPPKRNKVSFRYLTHTLEVIKFRLAVEEAVTQNPEIKLLFWSCKEDLVKKFEGKKIYKLIPDSLFVLNAPISPSFYFLEVDLATESVKSGFGKKMERYKSYYQHGLFEEKFGCKKFKVLVITTSNRRLYSFVKYAEKLNTGLIFWFTTLDKIFPESVLYQKIWMPGNGKRQWYSLIKEV
jgi:hypothetical protein